LNKIDWTAQPVTVLPKSWSSPWTGGGSLSRWKAAQITAGALILVYLNNDMTRGSPSIRRLVYKNCRRSLKWTQPVEDGIKPVYSGLQKSEKQRPDGYARGLTLYAAFLGWI